VADPVALVRSDLSGPGIRRRRHGRGFRYLGPDGAPVRDLEVLARIKALVIPPAWEDVWISGVAHGHIQAVGTDAAGRRQYRYHDLWREQRDREKHDRVLEFGAVLPRVRTVVLGHLDGPTLSRDRVLAAAIRLVDLGFFRPGGDEYAVENGSYGLATIRRDHVTCRRTELVSTTSASPRSTASRRSRTSAWSPWSAASNGAGTAATACSPTAAARAGTT
jgi:DNA topoisomerase IB